MTRTRPCAPLFLVVLLLLASLSCPRLYIFLMKFLSLNLSATCHSNCYCSCLSHVIFPVLPFVSKQATKLAQHFRIFFGVHRVNRLYCHTYTYTVPNPCLLYIPLLRLPLLVIWNIIWRPWTFALLSSSCKDMQTLPRFPLLSRWFIADQRTDRKFRLIEGNAKCRHIQKWTLRQAFIRVYRMEIQIQSVMLAFSTQLCELLPL